MEKFTIIAKIDVEIDMEKATGEEMDVMGLIQTGIAVIKDVDMTVIDSEGTNLAEGVDKGELMNQFNEFLGIEKA